jgi:hypothetical protein
MVPPSPQALAPASGKDPAAPGLVDLGLLRGKLHLDRLLIHVELLLAKLVLCGQLIGRAFRLLL